MDDKTTDKPHDTRLKELFENKPAFISFLRDCVKLAWTDDIDEENLKRSPKSFILQDFRKKETDILYEAKLKNSKEKVFFYVLLENQSRVDYRMNYRLLLYIVEILRDYYNHADVNERKRRDFKFPAVVPLVFYTGRDKWTAAATLKEMFAGYERFGDNLLDFTYTLVDAKNYDEENVKNFSSKLLKIMMLLERSRGFDEAIETAKRHKNEIWELNDEERRVLDTALDILEEVYGGGEKFNLKEILHHKNTGRVNNMLTDVINNGKKLIKKSRAEGRAEARSEAYAEKIEMAKDMIVNGEPIEKIAKYLRLTIEQVEAVNNEMSSSIC